MPTGIYNHNPHSKETKDKIGKSHKGKHYQTEISKKKIGEAHKGEKNHKWKGDKATKNVLHRYVEKRELMQICCEECGQKRKLNLANVKGHNYSRNIEDYRWLCYPCHSKMDKKKDICINGHDMIISNVFRDNRGHRHCKICKKEYNKRYKTNLINKLAGEKIK